MKLCKDCFWAQNQAADLKTARAYDWICLHPSSLLMPDVDLVLGDPSRALCLAARNGEGDAPSGKKWCGPEGRYWEERA